MDAILKVAIQLPIFSPPVNPNPTRERSSTELRFSRWNNANADKQGGTVYLFRGKNYNYETRLRFPFMRWKPVSPKNPVEHLCNEPLDISILSNSDDVSLHKAVSCPTENSNLSVPVVTDAASLPMKSCEAETTEDVMAISREPQMLPGTNNNSGSNIVDLYSDKFSGAADVSETSRSALCMEGILSLLEQAVEKGSALVLDDEYLDDDYIYQITVAFGKSAPPEPVYKLPRQVIIVKRDRRNYQCYDERGKNG
ncbi:hypothetical protein JHK85_026240 [Glycine max]|nr:hypothetical protein JHK85_026240 [Glycine max]